MNLQHIKYAAEVAETGSLNKAAEKLLIGQPNLSRAIKELENSLNIKIFERTSKGMVLTADGKIFMEYAKNILKQVDAIEKLFIRERKIRKRFSLSAPHAKYISDTFIGFSDILGNEQDAEFLYRETDSANTIKNVISGDYSLGIIRYAEIHDRYYRTMLSEKGLKSITVTTFYKQLVMNRNCHLVNKENINSDDLSELIEVSDADPQPSFLPVAELKKEEYSYSCGRRVEITERESRLLFLTNNTQAFMWSSPMSSCDLERYDLTQIKYSRHGRMYKDVLIYKNDYNLSETDELFIEKLKIFSDESFQECKENI